MSRPRNCCRPTSVGRRRVDLVGDLLVGVPAARLVGVAEFLSGRADLVEQVLQPGCQRVKGRQLLLNVPIVDHAPAVGQRPVVARQWQHRTRVGDGRAESVPAPVARVREHQRRHQ